MMTLPQDLTIESVASKICTIPKQKNLILKPSNTKNGTRKIAYRHKYDLVEYL